MSAIVYQNKVNGPATHAIVIGVGHYPHLVGGGKKPFAGGAGMGQLKSPPSSARAMAKWLIEEYNNPDKPLASVSLLLSDSANSKFTYSAKGKKKTVKTEPAKMKEVKASIRAWRQLGHENPDHLLLFFFCGHGTARGTDLALLLSDFGEAEVAPLDGAIDFRRFRQGMDECEAREQCYFVDACRVGLEVLIKSDYAGDPIIQATGTINTSGRTRQAPVFYSTLRGDQAYANPGKPSLFTAALLEALAGPGAGNEKGNWRVRTIRLHDALSFLVEDASEQLQVPRMQIPTVDENTSIELNVIAAAPQVPVVVTCLPGEANSEATLICQSGVMKKTRKPKNEPWRLRLPVDSYDFVAKYKAKDIKKNQSIWPAFGKVFLDVNQ